MRYSGTTVQAFNRKCRAVGAEAELPPEACIPAEVDAPGTDWERR